MVSEVMDSWIRVLFVEYFSRGFTGLLLFTQIRPTLPAIAERQFFPPPEPLQLSIGNSSQNWKRF